ncbi:MAG: HAD family hydrolase [Chloroflexi bacterium]|nr:HAD family hydrolase [Chloroflexota bacterium]MCI0793025.1 HAD family hydrolase [Chloroflexota bacterium]MCI0798319.1 HAD family hydrolase [Chloroflexota bacterium]MCI0859435.1 HAD family hydrolase [Chloroflexota bacterium]MCI0879697.1 HAD family hydrolase [Chloroflexota bacterium]
MAEITAVTFDLWQTLLLDNRELGRARAQVRLEGTQEALGRAGVVYDLEHIREAYRACYRECRRIRDQNLDVSFRDQVEIFINNIDVGMVDRLDEETIQEIIRVYADSFFVHPPVPHSDALSVLGDVKAMGLRIGLISNTGMTPGSTFRRYLDQQGMLKYFDTLTFSDEVKLAKPSDEIFLLTLRSLGADPPETVHVGDHVQNDVVGAKRCGLKTVWITGFYENENPSDPDTMPDVTVDGLAEVVPAIAGLAGRTPHQ